MIKITKLNASFVRVDIDDFGLEQEFSDFFTFLTPGHQFMPKFRSGIWDGKTRLYNGRNKQLPYGLVEVAKKFAELRDEKIEANVEPNELDIEEKEILEFIDSLNLHARGKPIELREYQREAIVRIIQQRRCIAIAPTSSGKSALLYCLIRWLLSKEPDERILLVVPSTQLVEQMFSDFADYSSGNGWDVESEVQMLYSGKDKVFSKSVMISTWQSLNAMMKNGTKMFADIVEHTTVGLFDEAHVYKSTEVIKTMDRFVNAYRRVGTTGTLDGSKINELTLTGLIGPTFQVITTKKLMDDGHVTPLKIQAIVLRHPEELRKFHKGMKYTEEINFIISSEQRNKFISRLALSCSGNTLILYNFVEKHGSVIYEDLIRRNTDPDRKIYFIHGAVATKEREIIRKIVEIESNAIIVATASLFSTGTNIPSLENIIFAIPTKSTIRVRQSIGRGLRLKSGKKWCTLYDISDDITYKNYRNTTLKHLAERIRIYDKEQFDYKIVKIDL